MHEDNGLFTPKKLLLIIAILLVVSVFIWSAFAFDGDLSGTTSVSGFSVCGYHDLTGGSLISTTLSTFPPSRAIQVCGILEANIKNPAAKHICLRFDIYRNRNIADRQEFCPSTTGYFTATIKSDELFLPGKYVLEVFDVSRRNWQEYAEFEIK